MTLREAQEPPRGLTTLCSCRTGPVQPGKCYLGGSQYEAVETWSEVQVPFAS